MTMQTRKTKAVEPAVDKNIYRRGKYSFQVKMMVGGHKISQVCDTLEEARAFRDSKRAASSLDPDFKRVLESRVKKSEAVSYTLGKLLEKYRQEVTPRKKSAVSESYRIGKVLRHNISKRSIYTFSQDDVQGFLDDLADEGVSESGRRKYCALLSHVFNTAVKRWRLKVSNPIPAMEMPAAGKPRKRRLEKDEERKMLQALDSQGSPYPAAFVRLAIETAMRRGELLSLTWENVDLEEKVAMLPETKNGEAREVPLSEAAREVLRGLPKPWAGPVLPISMSSLRGAWERALKENGITDLRIHDLRHEATSRLFEKGLNPMEVAAITGHKTLQMLKRYTHLRAEDLAKKLG